MYKKLYLNLARNSLRYIIKTYQIKELNIPYYLCETVRQSLVKEDCKPLFYHIDDDFMPKKIFDKNEFVLYPNYFGICDKNVEILSKKYPNIIIDNAHSYYSEPKGFACFNSARKFLPVYNGSVLWIKKLDNSNFYPTEEYKEFINTDEEKEKREVIFENLEPSFISDKLKNEIENINNLKERKEKFLKFHEKYSDKNLLKIVIENTHSPFCYPILTEDENTADELANKLIKDGHKIYRYWKNLPKTYPEYKLYRRMIPIPVCPL